MKYYLTVSILFFSIVSKSQDYNLFNANSNKLYFCDATGLTSGIEFDSVMLAGDFTIYFNYAGIGDEFESDTCTFWGGNTCYKQDKPLWFGDAITRDFMGPYHFKTCQDNFLSFNFNLQPGDSSLFYQDVSQSFYMVYEGADTAMILGIPDSAKHFRISHYDVEGNTIYSPLKDEQIIIGKESGLTNFFRIDSFPLVLQPLALIGNLFPQAGIVHLTHEMVYDHHVGDEIQYLDQYINLYGPPYYNYTNYIKHTFLARSDSEDSISYTVERQTYNLDSNIITLDTITLIYYRNAIIAEIPFDKPDQDHSLVIPKFYKSDYCELNLWSYSLESKFLSYCPDDNCWGSYDIPGPPPDEEKIYVCGLGLYLDKDALSAPPPEGYSHIYKIIYFKKDGIECGEEVVVGMDEKEITGSCIYVYPNPAKDRLFLRIDKIEEGELIFSNLQGQVVKQIPVNNHFNTIQVGDLENGMYLLQYRYDSSVEIRRIIVSH